MELVRDRLVAALRARGIDYLAPSDAAGEPISDEMLVASLAASEDPRLRQALIMLFLLQPGLALIAQSLRPKLAPTAETELVAHYMAAVYLQRLWRVRLELYLPGMTKLPDYFSQELHLPDPEDGHGKPGLHALAEWHAAHSPSRANRLSEYQVAANILLERLKREARRRVAASPG